MQIYWLCVINNQTGQIEKLEPYIQFYPETWEQGITFPDMKKIVWERSDKSTGVCATSNWAWQILERVLHHLLTLKAGHI